MIFNKKLLQLLTHYNNHYKFKFNLIFLYIILIIVENLNFYKNNKCYFFDKY